jgi:glycerol-3-phosphate acyltransferase PlsY
VQSILAIIASYLLGSISFSFLAGKLLKGIDIRNHGSGNAGATNTLRILGKKPAIAVLLLDGLKGVLAVWFGFWFIPDSDLMIVPILCGLAAVIGHNWPVYFGFRGGKGIATTIGVMATLAFWPTIISGITAIVIITITRYVSLGSLILTAMLPVLILLFDLPLELFVFSLLVMLFAFYRHRTNIIKLWNGTENKLGSKRT